MPQQRRAEQDSGKNLAQYRRLSKLVHQLAGEFSRSQQNGERQEHRHHIVLCKVWHAGPKDLDEIGYRFGSVCNTTDSLSQTSSRFLNYQASDSATLHLGIEQQAIRVRKLNAITLASTYTWQSSTTGKDVLLRSLVVEGIFMATCSFSRPMK